MKVKFIVSPPGGRTEYKAGDVVEFKGPAEESHARKYIDRGWAEEYTAPAKAAAPQPAAAVQQPVQTQQGAVLQPDKK